MCVWVCVDLLMCICCIYLQESEKTLAKKKRKLSEAHKQKWYPKTKKWKDIVYVLLWFWSLCVCIHMYLHYCMCH